MNEFTSHALNVATAQGARYADIRIIDRREQVVSVKNGNVDGIGDQYSQGFGVRVLVGNSWGFASSAYIDKAEIERVTRLAVDIANASAQVAGEPVD
jgi:TldD protein